MAYTPEPATRGSPPTAWLMSCGRSAARGPGPKCSGRKESRLPELPTPEIVDLASDTLELSLEEAPNETITLDSDIYLSLIRDTLELSLSEAPEEAITLDPDTSLSLARGILDPALFPATPPCLTWLSPPWVSRGSTPMRMLYPTCSLSPRTSP